MLPSMKLADLAESNAETIARQWVKSVQTNALTPYYHDAPRKSSSPRRSNSTETSATSLRNPTRRGRRGIFQQVRRDRYADGSRSTKPSMP